MSDTARTTTAPPRDADRGNRRADGEPVILSRAWASSKVAIATVVILPFLGFLAAAGFAWWRGGLSVLDFALFGTFYLLTGFGVTVGFHRLFSHQSFRAVPWLRATLGVLGCMAVQGPIVNWVADHRKHHRFSDHEGDPHSPHLFDDHGLLGTLGGLWHAHIGWLFAAGRSEVRDYAPDLLKDRVLTTIDRNYGVWILLSFLLPGAIAYAVTGGNVAAGVSAFLFAGMARVFLLHHITWSVNSVCHTFGQRAFRTKDRSRNHPIVGWIGLGEGWHNNHHAFPASARHGLDEGQFDLSWQVIRLFQRLGWVHEVRVPTPERLAQARIGAESR